MLAKAQRRNESIASLATLRENSKKQAKLIPVIIKH